MAEPKQQQLHLTAAQLASLVVVDQIGSSIVTGIQQLRGVNGCDREAEVLERLHLALSKDKELMLRGWASKVQLVSAAAMPPAPIIPSR